MKNVGDALSQTRHFSLFDLNDEIDHSGTGILPLEDFTLQAAKNIGQLICSKMFKNLFQKEKRSTILFMPEEKRSTIVFMPERKRSTLLNNIDTREMLYA